ncbi:PucR family transcriptional regulator [Paenibacillus macerans]|uniref:PucR family transcriptional regulator n=1 Tax=Paenibacillus macerans TaxID=44252 RepID=UPI00203F822D|nr:PucR family transcriptional regulator [Paenibacillus macerans]MCM3702405.1 PucR family transcriptional regulator [Paenibacillus macerans]
MNTTRRLTEPLAREFRCADLFHMNSLPNLKLLAGECRLDNAISRVNIMEVPDIQNWAQANEFLVTTGYSHHHNMDAFLEIIPRLVERGVAALGIKPKRFITDIPRQIIDCAEAYELPLFELPESTIFSNVVREVMEKVISLETKNVLLLQQRLEQVAELMLHGREMPRIVEAVEAMVGNPLCILGAEGRMIASPRHTTYFSPFRERLMNLNSNSPQSRSVITVPGKPPKGSDVRLHVFNLWEAEKDPILVLLAEKNGECTELDLSTVSRILPLINIRLSGENTYNLVKAKYFDDFIKDWLTGVVPSAEQLDIKGRLYGYDGLSSKTYRAAIVKFHAGSPPALDSGLIAELTRSAPNDSLFTSIGGKIIGLLPQTANSGAVLTPEDTEPLFRHITDVCGTDDFSLCVGEASGPLAVNDSYIDAENLYTASCISKENARLITWERLGIYAVLSLLPKHANVDKYLGRYVKPLVVYDEAHHSSLIQTLKVYFQMGGNIKLTAQNMYTHYNTVVYRLDKIKSLLGISFDDPEARLQLQLGLKIYEMGE